MDLGGFDFKQIGKDTLLGLTSSVKRAIGGAMNVSDNLDGAISELTTQTYSVLYGTLSSVSDIMSNNSETTEERSSTQQENTGSQMFTSWDPRLSRIDSYLSVNGKGSPTIVPFSSITAAGAFYDMVFSIEKAVGDAISKMSENESKKDDATSTSTKDITDNNSISSSGTEDYSSSSKVIAGDKNVIKSLQNDPDSYGVASIVNPYTLTKLCGGLTMTNTGDDKAFDNRLYDIRDKRRFYDRSIDKADDVLSISNPTTTNIITYSNADPWGRTPYYFQDFVFCKYWNIIPNNRLITLRKYHAPVYDNLQFSTMYKNDETVNEDVVFAPIATVLTYFGEDTGNTLSSLLSFSTGTNWRDIKSDVYKPEGNMGDNPRGKIDDLFLNGNNGFPTGNGPNWLQGLIGKTNMLTANMFSFGKFVGLLSPGGYNINQDKDYFDKMTELNKDPTEELYNNKLIGPVNRIASTKARDVGITYNHSITVICEYVARPIGGVNTKAAMLDILSNCLEIGSVEAMFWGGGYRFNIKPALYPFKNTAFKNTILDDLYAGRIFGKNGALAHSVEGLKEFGSTSDGQFDWSTAMSKIKNTFGQTLGAIGELIGSITQSLFGSGFQETMNKWANGISEGSAEEGKEKVKAYTTNLNDMWRSNVIKQTMLPSIHGMRALLTGEPVGNWHLTVGNPLNPIMVVGNLICKDMKVEFSDELGPDDFPLNMKVTYTLEHAMDRDKAAIQSMFNRGNGKIYQLPDYIKASSDYETKVDDYTGPSTNGANGWYTPKYMSSLDMLSKIGGGGYQTYKMSQPKAMALNAHTENIFIAKFTPVDVDAAISNIKSGSKDFFTANPRTRAWIRGAGITRKLMN